MGWFKDAVTRVVTEMNNKTVRVVQDHEVYSAATRSYQIWELENGFLLVDYGSNNHGGFPGDRNQASYYPDLKALYEGMVTRRTQEKLGMEKAVASPAYPTSSMQASTFGAAGT